ncbi:hypothetical protein VPH35_118002 [Triticum aestivum]
MLLVPRVPRVAPGRLGGTPVVGRRRPPSPPLLPLAAAGGCGRAKPASWTAAAGRSPREGAHLWWREAAPSSCSAARRCGAPVARTADLEGGSSGGPLVPVAARGMAPPAPCGLRWRLCFASQIRPWMGWGGGPPTSAYLQVCWPGVVRLLWLPCGGGLLGLAGGQIWRTAGAAGRRQQGVVAAWRAWWLGRRHVWFALRTDLIWPVRPRCAAAQIGGDPCTRCLMEVPSADPGENLLLGFAKTGVGGTLLCHYLLEGLAVEKLQTSICYLRGKP